MFQIPSDFIINTYNPGTHRFRFFNYIRELCRWIEENEFVKAIFPSFRFVGGYPAVRVAASQLFEESNNRLDYIPYRHIFFLKHFYN